MNTTCNSAPDSRTAHGSRALRQHADLRALVGEQALIGIVLQTVEQASAGGVDLSSAVPHTAAELPPAALLSLLTYSYACGIYSSNDIAFRLWQHGPIAGYCDGQGTDAHTLRSFRRRHRPAITRCLAQVLERMWDSPAATRTSGSPPLPAPAAGPLCVSREHHAPSAACWFEAEERVFLAVRIDSMMLDE